MPSQTDLFMKRKCAHLYSLSSKNKEYQTITEYNKGSIESLSQKLKNRKSGLQTELKKNTKKPVVEKSIEEPVHVSTSTLNEVEETGINKLGPVTFSGMEVKKQVISASNDDTKETYRKGKEFWDNQNNQSS